MTELPACPECGAAMADVEAHERWHAAQAWAPLDDPERGERPAPMPSAEKDAHDPRCTSLSEDDRRCHGDVGHPGTHWAGAMRIWSDTETLSRPIPPERGERGA